MKYNTYNQLNSSDELATLKEQERIERLEAETVVYNKDTGITAMNGGELAYNPKTGLIQDVNVYAAEKWGANLEDWDEENQD